MDAELKKIYDSISSNLDHIDNVAMPQVDVQRRLLEKLGEKLAETEEGREYSSFIDDAKQAFSMIKNGNMQDGVDKLKKSEQQMRDHANTDNK